MEKTELATAQVSTPKVVPIGNNEAIQIDEFAKDAIVDTHGSTTYPFRLSLPPVKMTSTDLAGASLFEKTLDVNITTTTQELGKQFIYYKYVSLAINLRCTAPWSTASGSAQIYFNPDPENPIPSDRSAAMDFVMRLFGSKQLSSKGEITAEFPVSNFAAPMFGKWRYCRAGENSQPRLEQFGTVGAIVRGSPTEGDYAIWTMTMTGAIQFRAATINSTISTREFHYQSTSVASDWSIIDVQNINQPLLRYSKAFQGPDSAGMFYSDDADTVYVIVSQDGQSAHFAVDTLSANYVMSGGIMNIYFGFIDDTSSIDFDDLDSLDFVLTTLDISGVCKYEFDSSPTYRRLVRRVDPATIPQRYSTFKRVLTEMRLGHATTQNALCRHSARKQ
ncbi:putative structural protein [Beihai sea slater virus 4]|uniref:putative structural protein n=1 Tax=Beihai sea slater virus 4 TaxID=1922660 RepID=UPI00090BFE56|nr:putative structural protein [Beihai sea slater virus 4]APG77557.1 putative structural protein [Beihai sea slater virus 4]